MRHKLLMGLCCGLLVGGSAHGNLFDLFSRDRGEAEESTISNRGRLKVEFVGNGSFDARQLERGIERQYQMVEDYGLNEASAYDLGYFLEVFYRKQGYSQVAVTATVLGPWSLRLGVVEGPLTRLGDIRMTGFRSYDWTYLQDFLLGPLRERFPRVRPDRALPFVESDIESGVDLIRRLYAAEGFLDAEVELLPTVFAEDFAFGNVAVTISEGRQYSFGNVTFEGQTAFSDEQLRAVVAKTVTEPFTVGRAAAALRALEDYFQRNGYFEATGRVRAEEENARAEMGLVDVAFVIEQGELFRFGRVKVEGDDHVPSTFVENRMRSLQGKVYDPKLVDDRFRVLLNTGLFTNIRITPEPGEGDELDLNVRVEPARTKIFGVGVGYGTFVGGIFSLNYTDLNLFGSGRPLATSAEITQRGYSGEVLYTDPWVFETENELKLRLYAQTIELEGYSKNELGFRPSLSRQLTKHWEVSAFVLAKTVRTVDVLIEPESLVGAKDYSVASVGFTQTLDFRNDPALPTEGFLGSMSVDLSPEGIGDTAFVRGTASAVYYLPVTERTTLALGAGGGVISPLSDGELPIDERFFNGGATTVRSFPELKLGPRSRAGYPLGGEVFTVFNAEYTFPIWDQIRGAVFVDAGNVLPQADDFGLSDLRYAVGGGLRYNLPVGPIRFDYGLNPDPQTGEAQGAFHFSIGLAF